MSNTTTTAVDWLREKVQSNLSEPMSPKFAELFDRAREMQKDDAVAFAEWLHRNRWFNFEDGKWNYTFEMGTAMSKQTYDKNYRKTTAELYDMYYNETYGKSE